VTVNSIIRPLPEAGHEPMGTCWIGTSGYTYDDWKEIFYPRRLPQKKWLAHYAQHYDTVEINATFYRYFPQTVFARWRDETPENFRFTLKGPRDITHVKKLDDIDDELKRFMDSIQDLCSKVALLLWQFPPSFQYSAKEKLVEFMQRLPAGMKHVFEFRHKSWFKDDVYDLLNRHHAGFVMNDSSRFPATEMITGDVVYIRFHGPVQLYASLYDTEALTRWAGKIKTWLQQYDVYVYFNNDYGGRALQNSVELRNLISQPLPV
jgi:uncharacterized protein YecE (DUF72 family)